MRGLGIRASRSVELLKAGSPVIAGFAALGLLAALLVGCSAGGTGARDEGPARTAPVASAVPSPAASPVASATPKTVNAVRLVKDDPKVSTDIKRDLKPCVADEYPVDVSYGTLTGGPANDVVVNVMTCGDAVGIGTYVYRDEDGTYRNVFQAEEPPVYAEIDRGDLVVTKQVYEKGDSVASPSGEEVVTYRWDGDRFAQQGRIHNDYSHAVGGDSPAPAATDDAG
ncbi:hypothetical protein [Streptomyces xanthii]|uniref:hypothetical protein n=1 Tax=Streptomyces xanthii TaxID=2768069 RepID=UPI00374E1949